MVPIGGNYPLVTSNSGGDILPLINDLLPAGNGFLVMLKGYLDRGEKADATTGIMCVASVIFKPVQYTKFIRPWNRMLDRWNATAFHATDFYNGAEEFKRDTNRRKLLFEQDSRRIPAMIGQHVYRVLLVAFNPDEFNSTAPAGWKEKFGTSIHAQAAQLSLIANGWWRDKRCPSQSLAYVMESGDPDETEVISGVARMKRDEQTARVIRVVSFTTADKGTARGTEAADFAAWHWNKYYLERYRTGQPLNPRRDFRAFAGSVKGGVQCINATGDMLKYFFSLIPPESLDQHIDTLLARGARDKIVP